MISSGPVGTASSGASSRWPAAHEYAEAIQNPATCFLRKDLQAARPVLGKLGLPIVATGNFASVYRLITANGDRAIRCFRGFLGDREERYRAIDAHLRAHPLRGLVGFQYLNQGILVGGKAYPILVMDWVNGSTLDTYIEGVLGQKDQLDQLAEQWLRLVSALEDARIAHGDLQHGNILISNGQIVLVDYDGMFVPSLAGRVSPEAGHQHYQHPRRAASDYAECLDRFSALVIGLSLRALAVDPGLWREFHDENLIFRRRDFEDPDGSPLFARLERLGGECARLAKILEDSCRGDPFSVPALSDVWSPNNGLPWWIPPLPTTGSTLSPRGNPIPRPPQSGRPGGIDRFGKRSASPRLRLLRQLGMVIQWLRRVRHPLHWAARLTVNTVSSFWRSVASMVIILYVLVATAIVATLGPERGWSEPGWDIALIVGLLCLAQGIQRTIREIRGKTGAAPVGSPSPPPAPAPRPAPPPPSWPPPRPPRVSVFPPRGSGSPQ